MRVLFVCLGNICRSPAAEAVVAGLAPGWSCDSAGTGGWHVGDPPHPPMQAAARARGHDLSGQRARRFLVGDFDRFDLIVAMDAQNRADIEALRPFGATTPVRLMDPDRDVPDPYYSGDYDGCLDVIEAAARRLVSDTTSQRSG